MKQPKRLYSYERNGQVLGEYLGNSLDKARRVLGLTNIQAQNYVNIYTLPKEP